MLKKFFTAAEICPRHVQPFGPNFGLTVFPGYILPSERDALADTFDKTSRNNQSECVQSDGCIQIPPVDTSVFEPILTRMEEEGHIPPNWLNNQTCNLYPPEGSMRAHIDNLFIYDDIILTIGYGGPATLRWVHARSGKEVETLIPEHSVYVMQGASRYLYFHMLLPLETQRCSVVCRRSIFQSTGTFQGVDPHLKTMMPYKANAAVNTLVQNGIGSPHLSIDDKYMEQEQLGPWDTGKLFRALHPLQHWTLTSQLDQDEATLKDLFSKYKLSVDLQWRVDELRGKFKELDEKCDSP